LLIKFAINCVKNMVKVKKDNQNTISLSKYIAHAGFCSRRKATMLIKDGLVMVNEKIITDPGYKVS